MSLVKYRVHEVAKDFGLTSKVVTDIMTEFLTTPKNHMQVLDADELNLIFDVITQRNQKVDEISAPVQDIDARYWAGQVQKGNVTVEELAHFASTTWLGSTSAKQQKLALIEQYVQAGQPVSITPQERMASSCAVTIILARRASITRSSRECLRRRTISAV